MRKILLSALAATSCFVFAGNANAGAFVCSNTGAPSPLPACPHIGVDNVLVTTGTGLTVSGSTHGGANVTYSAAGQSITGEANGQATVGATDGTTNFLQFMLTGGTFYFATFNVSPLSGNAANEATSLTITFLTALGSQTVTIDTNGNNDLGVYSDNGTQFSGLSFTTGLNQAGGATYFSDLRQLRLAETGVTPTPEPGTWMMMLLGFGAVGFGMRRRRRTSFSPLQIA